MLSLRFPFRPKILSSLNNYSLKDFGADLSAGITVGFVALPLAMAFAIASGLKPEAGLFTAIVAGFLISSLGGSKVQIGGPAGAFIVLVYGIVSKYGVDGLIVSTVLAGFLLFLMGLLKAGTLVRFVPISIIIGFTNGIAVLIGLSQIKDLLGLKIDHLPSDFFPKTESILSHLNTIDLPTLILSVASLAIVVGWPAFVKKTGIKALQAVPGSILALALGTMAVAVFDIPVETIGTRFGGIPSSLPSLTIPTINLSIIQDLINPTITIALLGAIESLLCARVADGLIGDRHDPNQELMAQGIANVVAPMFGGYCATGTIARTITNIRMGGKTPVAGIIHALVVFAIIALAAPLAKNVPLATLGAILIFVSYNMGEWHEFVRMRHFALNYRLILMATFILTVVVDLAVAVEVGLVMSLLFFVTRMASLTRLEPILEIEAEGHAKLGDDIEAYRLLGSLFFGAVHKLEEISAPGYRVPKVLILSLTDLINMDASGLDELEGLYNSLKKKGCQLLICGANGQPLNIMRRTKFMHEMGEEKFFDSTSEALEHASLSLQKLKGPQNTNS